MKARGEPPHDRQQANHQITPAACLGLDNRDTLRRLAGDWCWWENSIDDQGSSFFATGVIRGCREANTVAVE